MLNILILIVTEFDIVMQVFYVMVEVIFHMVNGLLILRKHHPSIFFFKYMVLTNLLSLSFSISLCNFQT